MVARAEVYWAQLPDPVGRRPVCVVTRDSAIPFLSQVVVAPITTVARGVRSEVRVEGVGLPHPSVISCDNVLTVPKGLLDDEPTGRLDVIAEARLDGALRFALGIRY